MRQAIRFTGKTFISLGVVILAFVAYQLWGTSIAQGRDQKALKSRLSQELASPPAVVPSAPAAAPERQLGAAVALLRIPKIGVDQAVVEGVGVEDLKKGPGHYPETRMPGETGNAAIAGHRTTYGAPFDHLDELKPGDPLLVTTKAGRFRYEVTQSMVVSPSAIEVLDETTDARLTLTTCHPRFSAAQRLIVVSKLVGPAIEPPPAPPIELAPPEPGQPVDPARRAGLSGAAAAKQPAVVSGLLAALVWAVTSLVARSWQRRWLAYALGAPVFFVILFVFFENVARLLPANV
ncbi:MAG: class E sortase [Acidimicrobiales bacterium]